MPSKTLRPHLRGDDATYGTPECTRCNAPGFHHSVCKALDTRPTVEPSYLPDIARAFYSRPYGLWFVSLPWQASDEAYMVPVGWTISRTSLATVEVSA